MLNKEKYKEEIWKFILKHGRIPAVTKDGFKLCEVTSCYGDKCRFNYGDYSRCNEGFLDWLNSEYVEAEIDWTKVPVDTPVIVSNDKERWYTRYFALFDNGKLKTWSCGATSWSVDDKSELVSWNYKNLANEEDIQKYRKE